MIQKFEDLIAWQKSRIVNKAIYKLTIMSPFSNDRAFVSQIRRASLSVMSNIAEGFDRRSKKEFLQFLKIAKGSCAEVKSQLYAAFDLNYLKESVFNEIREQVDEVGRIISGLMKSLRTAN